MNGKIIDHAISSRLDWSLVEGESYVFFAIFENEKLMLRLNDFPEEPLLTLTLREERADLDEWPEAWTLPKHRE